MDKMGCCDEDDFREQLLYRVVRSRKERQLGRSKRTNTNFSFTASRSRKAKALTLWLRNFLLAWHRPAVSAYWSPNPIILAQRARRSASERVRISSPGMVTMLCEEKVLVWARVRSRTRHGQSGAQLSLQAMKTKTCRKLWTKTQQQSGSNGSGFALAMFDSEKITCLTSHDQVATQWNSVISGGN